MTADSIANEKIEPLNKPMMFTHGTMECHSFPKSRPFYEEFLGLECVRHAQRAMMLRKGQYFGLVVLETGDLFKSVVSIANHWGLDFASRDEVDRAHKLAHEHKAKYGIKKIGTVQDNHGTYGFYLQDLDGNWWEMQYAGEGQGTGNGRYDRYYRKGDSY